MEVHGIHQNDGRKEITCSDCGHIYLVAQGQRGGRCQSCGNIEFLGDETGLESPELTALSQEIVAKRVMPRLQANFAETELAKAESADSLSAFRVSPDGNAVEEIRIRYQVEWQLWAALTKQFQDPVHHMAYICQATTARELDRAAERYREHRSVMALLPDSRWQADVADLMLTKIENISAARLGIESGAKQILPEWLMMLPLDGRVFRFGWIILGLTIAVRFFVSFEL